MIFQSNDYLTDYIDYRLLFDSQNHRLRLSLVNTKIIEYRITYSDWLQRKQRS